MSRFMGHEVAILLLQACLGGMLIVFLLQVFLVSQGVELSGRLCLLAYLVLPWARI